MWHKHGVPKGPPRDRRPPPPLDAAALERLALRYVEKFATSRGKLADYLARKLRERGGEGVGEDDIARAVARCVAAGYVDDEAFAEQRAQSLSRRGFGHRRVAMTLTVAGIERHVVEALAPDDDEALAAAERFAKRRRFGRFASEPADRDEQRRQVAAMLRAGHSSSIALRVVGKAAVAERDEADRE